MSQVKSTTPENSNEVVKTAAPEIVVTADKKPVFGKLAPGNAPF